MKKVQLGLFTKTTLLGQDCIMKEKMSPGEAASGCTAADISC